jgi:putative addiction module component (TIGR02574 family)
MTKATLFKQALKLSPKDRGEIASRLFESLEEPVKADKDAEKLWVIEIKRRLAEIKSGKAKYVDGEKLLAQLKRKYAL